MFKKYYHLLPLFFAIICLYSCNSKNQTSEPDTPASIGGTPVTLTSINSGTITETTELNATSVFQLKSFVKANATGYLQQVNAQLGKYVTKGQELFVLKNKEAEALGNTVNSLDSTFQFTGIVHIKSPGSGYVSTLNYRAGDYVTDGEQLAVISDINSFAFLLDLPYELKNYLAENKNLTLKLPDGTILSGYVSALMPTVDAVSQTQQVVIKVNTQQQIPENLIAKVTIIKKTKPNTISLPKAAVITDDTQSEFWIMKLTDSTTAVKVPIKKGIETDNSIEILSPKLTTSDKILLTGNYGLPDTAKVIVIRP